MIKCYTDYKGKDTVCGTIKVSLDNCTQPLVTAFESCVDAKYQDVPKFIVEIAKSATEYICKSKGEKLIGKIIFFIDYLNCEGVLIQILHESSNVQK